MTKAFKVDTQGISLDLAQSTGDYGTIDRGTMTQEQLLTLLNNVKHLPDPQEANPDADLCPPHVMVEGTAGQFSFIPAGSGQFYNVELDVHVSPIEAAAIPAGSGQPAGGYVQPQAASQAAQQVPPQQHAQHVQNVPQGKPRKKKRGFFGWIVHLILLFVLIFVGLVIYAMVFGKIDDTGAYITCGIAAVVWWLIGLKTGGSSSSRSSSGNDQYDNTHYYHGSTHHYGDNDDRGGGDDYSSDSDFSGGDDYSGGDD